MMNIQKWIDESSVKLYHYLAKTSSMKNARIAKLVSRINTMKALDIPHRVRDSKLADPF